MWGMEQTDALALERPGYRDLLREGVVLRGRGDRSEVVAERTQNLSVLGPAEQHEFGVAIQSRQLPEQIANVGADPKIVELPSVYADAHGLIILRGGRRRRNGDVATLQPLLPFLPKGRLAIADTVGLSAPNADGVCRKRRSGCVDTRPRFAAWPTPPTAHGGA
jgi:hypothetical protein